MPTFQIFKCERILQELVFINSDIYSSFGTFQNTEESEIIQKQ